MKNLFWGIAQVERGERAERLAEMQIYTIRQLLLRWFRVVCWAVSYCVARIAKKLTSPAPDSLRMMYEKEQKSVQNMNEKQLRNYLIRLISKKLKCRVKEKNSDDENSAVVTKGVLRLLGKKTTKGLSFSEINRLIHDKYPAKKKNNRQLLVADVILSLLAAAAVVVLMIVTEGNKGILLACGIAALVLINLCLDLVMKYNARCCFIWLAVSGIRNAGEERARDNSGRAFLEEKFKLVHTLRALMENGQKENAEKQQKIEELKELQKRNNTLILKSQDDREKNDKQRENAKIQAEIVQISERMNKDQIGLLELKQTHDSTSEHAAELLGKYWNNEYPRILFGLDVVRAVVEQFPYKDLDVIEQRYEELLASEAPATIAKKEKKSLYVEFRSVEAGVGRLYFQTEKNRLTITGVGCTQKLREALLSAGDMERILKGNAWGEQPRPSKELLRYATELEERLLEERKRAKEKIGELTNELSDVVQKNVKMVSEMIEIQDNYDSACELVEKQREELQQAEQKLHLLEEDKESNTEQILKLRREIDEKKNQIKLLEEKCDEYLKHILEFRREADEKEQQLTRKINEEKKRAEQFRVQETERYSRVTDQLRQQISQLNTSLAEKNAEIAAKEEELQVKESELNTNEALLSKANEKIEELKKNKKTPDDQAQTTIQKLKATVEKEKEQKKKVTEQHKALKKEVEDIQNELKETKKNYTRVSNELKTALEGNGDYLQKIENLREKQFSGKNEILISQQIVDKFYELIENAKEYVYLIYPSIAYPNANPFDRIRTYERTETHFENAFRNNPKLKIKIQYGMCDDESNPRMLQKKKNSQKGRAALEAHFKGKQLKFIEINTHIKLAIIDGDTYLLGSMNLLSSPDYKECPKLRSEIALLAHDKQVIDELLKKYWTKK